MTNLYQGRPDLQTLTSFSGLSDEAFRNLLQIAPHIKPHIPALTDSFYACLQSDGHTASHVRGRVDQLKVTHRAWLCSLFDGNYGEEFVLQQERIGRAHVAAKIPPLFVAASMSFLRAAFTRQIEQAAIALGEHEGKYISALLGLLDLCQYLIDRAYEEDRLDRLAGVTGMSRKLLENLISLKPKG